MNQLVSYGDYDNRRAAERAFRAAVRLDLPVIMTCASEYQPGILGTTICRRTWRVAIYDSEIPDEIRALLEPQKEEANAEPKADQG